MVGRGSVDRQLNQMSEKSEVAFHFDIRQPYAEIHLQNYSSRVDVLLVCLTIYVMHISFL